MKKLKEKVEKLEIENRTIKNIHQQTMRKIEMESLGKEGDDDMEQ